MVASLMLVEVSDAKLAINFLIVVILVSSEMVAK